MTLSSGGSPVRAVVRGIGHAVPPTIVTNDEIAQRVDTSDEWIVQRTGIRQRRICSETESTGSLAIEAGRAALANAGVSPADIDQIVVATISPEYPWPATACIVQDALGIGNASAYDVSAACAGFIYAADLAAATIETGRAQRVLVIGVDTLSKQLDWTDRSTCVLFGDAAGAVVFEADSVSNRGLLGTVVFSDGAGAPHIILAGGGSKYPMPIVERDGIGKYLTMNGKEVYRFAVKAMGDACERVLSKTGYTVADIDLFVPHQANLRIIESASERLGLAPDKVFINVQNYGNTSGGSIPLALSEAVAEGRLRPGMLVMTVGFGAGLVWGANLIRW